MRRNSGMFFFSDCAEMAHGPGLKCGLWMVPFVLCDWMISQLGASDVTKNST